MKLLGTVRQPFVGLALTAVTGIIAAGIFPLPSFALVAAAIILLIGILIVGCWPRLAATYFLVAACFFLLHNLSTTNTRGQQLARELGERPRVVTAIGCVISEPKIGPSGFATFLLKLRSVEFEGKKEMTSAVWQARWKSLPEFGDELKLFGTAEPIVPPRNPGEFNAHAYFARHDIRRMLLYDTPRTAR